MTHPAIIVISPEELALARRIAMATGGAVHGLSPRVCGGSETFRDTRAHLQALFKAGAPIIAIMACGAAIRLLAPVLEDKHSEPPVVCVAADGSVVVPLLGGHHGANDLARKIADAIGAVTAVTTAGDVKFGVALDAPPPGYRLGNPDAAKEVMAALNNGANARVVGRAPWLGASGLPISEQGQVMLTVTDEAVEAQPMTLAYHPATLVLGMGCERGADGAEAVELAEQVLARSGLSRHSLAAIASIDLKADENAIHAVSAHFGVPARFFTAADLEAQTPRLANPSDVVFAETGCHGVAEGAALALAGADAVLAVPKQKSKRVTAALARSARPLIELAGRARGKLFVVGIGPGSEGWRSPEVTAMIGEATDLVGYSLYLDLVAGISQGKVRHDFDLGREEDRVRHAMELAGQGRDVALVCSGGAGIYAMATLVFELIEKGGLTDGARRIEIAVSPGISALQGAAARAGAPLGHDFCTISLSDLLTPWPDIVRRVKAAAEGDFVIAFYNPVSKRRRTQLAHAKEVLLAHRPADTPVILAANLGRPGETVRIVPLTELDVDDVDTLTVVLVGSSQTRTVRAGDGRTWVYTPRGYAAKEGTGIANTEKDCAMTVYFIGAGPGAPDLITVRGLRLIERCRVCLYAGSLVPEEIVAAAPKDARVLDTAPMHLDSIIEEIRLAHEAGLDVARVHSGDPSIYGATAEQMRRLDALGIGYEVVPGVPAFAAAAARLATELTLPEIAQTVIVTRTGMKASSMPEHESLEELGRSRATLAIHLSIRNLDYIRRALEPNYGDDCPVVIAYRATWPDEQYIRTTLGEMKERVREAKITPTALVLVGRIFGNEHFRDSDLYNANYSHVLRNKGKKKVTA